MPTRALRSGEDLVSALESCTRELGGLCFGLELHQLQDEREDPDEDVGVEQDTLASLEEMTSECYALLARLEAEGNGADEKVDGGALSSTAAFSNQENNQQQIQGEEPNDPYHLEAGLTHELDSFAGELNNLLASLRVPSTEGNATGVETFSAPLSVDTVKLPGEESKSSCTDNEESTNTGNAPVTASVATRINVENGDAGKADEANVAERKKQRCTDNEENTNIETPVAATAGDDTNVESVSVLDANAAHLTRKNEVFSERTKKAIALHVKRLMLQKQRETQTEQERVAGVKIPWSRFQSSSFHQHIMRQKFARRRVKQIQDAQRLVEAARLKGSKPISYRRSKRNEAKEKVSAKSATYLDKFKPSCVHIVTPNEYEPRYLCAVYLYGLRRLGTTYITFSSLDQLEQRVRSRFDINEVVSAYREVTEVVMPASEYYNKRKRHVKRLQRISSLEQINDGDTLCVTQSAYDDMTILCDWIKQRQRIVHDFHYKVHHPTTAESSEYIEQRSIP
ncbi:hypothetical protein F442_21992, partial [Phytophthora nicotianae P10297]